jgi:YebC/PmpR family DNA-binding regulatory protein
MSGHNKWTQIKRQKAKTDAQKSKLFSKYSKLITTAVKVAGGDANDPNVRMAVDKAREYNMPNENIERAIKKATTDNSAAMEKIVYEAYGPGGTALIIEALTDNRNKAAQEVKSILSNHNMSLAGIGSAAWAFTKTHDGWIPNTTTPLNESDSLLLEKVIEELENNDEVQEVFTNAE